MSDFAGNVWHHHFGLSGITTDLLWHWLTKALGTGIFFGGLLYLPVWLSRETYYQPDLPETEKGASQIEPK